VPRHWCQHNIKASVLRDQKRPEAPRDAWWLQPAGLQQQKNSESGTAMKVSKARLREALQLRDAALRILNRVGYDITFADSGRGYCNHNRQAKINDLTIMCSRLGRGQLLDIWQGKKVFSISWTDGLPTYVVAFRPGTWKRSVARADVKFTLEDLECSAGLKKWLIETGG
jgi:hypothetical protein